MTEGMFEPLAPPTAEQQAQLERAMNHLEDARDLGEGTLLDAEEVDILVTCLDLFSTAILRYALVEKARQLGLTFRPQGDES